MTPELTHLQGQVLGCFDMGGAKAVSDIAGDLMISDSSARAALLALEVKALVARTYVLSNRHRFVYGITRKGREVCDAHFAD